MGYRAGTLNNLGVLLSKWANLTKQRTGTGQALKLEEKKIRLLNTRADGPRL